MTEHNESAPVLKDDEETHPIPGAWRPRLCDIVNAFVAGDLHLNSPILGVDHPDEATVEQIRHYLADYGETLTELPAETWQSSEYIWAGNHWDVLVDLWTSESGWSDMVLSVRVFEDDEHGYRMVIDMIYVP